MFSQLTYQDKEAFFDLLDEYFASRPHLFSGGSSSSSPTNARAPTYQSAASSGRALPPPAPRTGTPTSPPPQSPVGNGMQGEKPDLATRMVMSSLKMGTSGATKGISMISKNPQAMDALSRVGAAAIIKGTQAHLAGPQQSQGQMDGGGGGGPPAAPGSKKGGGPSGLVTSKTFGHVDTSSKMSAFTSMWKDPQKQPPAPVANTYQAPALGGGRGTALPPPRRGAPPPAPEEEEEAGGADGQAQVLYDYAGGDASDLGVQSGQIVNVLEKTSADWWQCEDGNGRRGLVPSSYLREV